MGEATYTFEVDEGLKARFAQAVGGNESAGAQILREFMEDYVRQQGDALEYDAWFRQEVRLGLASAKGGRLIPAGEAEAMFEVKRAATRLRLAE